MLRSVDPVVVGLGDGLGLGVALGVGLGLALGLALVGVADDVGSPLSSSPQAVITASSATAPAASRVRAS